MCTHNSISRRGKLVKRCFTVEKLENEMKGGLKNYKLKSIKFYVFNYNYIYSK